MNSLTRFFVGMIGGLVAACSKILALDISQLSTFLDQGNLSDLNDLKVTIYIFTPILVFLGGVIAWATSEESRMKLLAIGCAAPAIVAPWTAASPVEPLSAFHLVPGSIVSTAFAQERKDSAAQSKFVTGVKVLFGITRPEDQKYWVIVGSHLELQSALEYAAALNSSDPDLQAFVGQRKPDNPYYPVIVGGQEAFLSLAEAKALRDQASRSPLVPRDAYLSNYRDRTPALTTGPN
jgi:hypothetical protein